MRQGQGHAVAGAVGDELAADEVICATDAGREGELIFRYIQELAGATRKPSRRCWTWMLPRATR